MTRAFWKMTFAALLIGMGLSAGGCGRFRAKPKNDSPSGARAAQQAGPSDALPFKVFEAARQSPNSMAGAHELADALQDSYIAGDRIELSHWIQLSDPAGNEPEVFFVFGDQYSGEEIQSAVFSHEVMGDGNSDSESSNPKPVHEDPFHHRFYLSLSEIMRGFEQFAGPASQQVLNLDLTLAGGETRRVQILFRVRSDLPDVSQVLKQEKVFPLEPLPAPGDPTLSALQKYDHEGWVYAFEQYANPTKRPLLLWLHVPTGELSVVTKLKSRLRLKGSTQIIEPESLTDYAEHQSDYNKLSVGKLAFAGIQVSRAGKSFLAHFERNGWQAIRLGPEERVGISWLALPAPDEKVCRSGEAGPLLSLKFCLSGLDPGSRAAVAQETCPPGYAGGTRLPYESLWKVESFQLSGSFSREVLLTEDGVPSVTELSSGRGRELISGKPVQLFSGSDPAVITPAVKYSCQGVF